MQADAIVENFEGGSPVEEIADNFTIAQSTIREILSYDSAHQHVTLSAGSSLSAHSY